MSFKIDTSGKTFLKHGENEVRLRIPDGVVELDFPAFDDNVSLMNPIILKDVREIGRCALARRHALEVIDVGVDNPIFFARGRAFLESEKEVVRYPPSLKNAFYAVNSKSKCWRILLLRQSFFKGDDPINRNGNNGRSRLCPL